MTFSFFKSRLITKFTRLLFDPTTQNRLVKMRSNNPLVFIDCEVSLSIPFLSIIFIERIQMTGLNPEKETIMSISCFITDAQLELLDDRGWDSIIHHDKSILEQMDEWCTNTHGKSGLTAACIASQTNDEQAADSLLEYIKKYCPEPRKGLLAGNSVHCDKAFLSKPPYNRVTDYLSYRILDISSLKEAAKRWAPDDILLGVPSKKLLHQAREDILESIEEARYYRNNLFAK